MTGESVVELRNPGPVRPAPVLAGPAGELAAIIAGWPGVAGFTHWRPGAPGVVDGAEFHLGAPELGHIHLDGTAHVPLDRALAAILVREGLGRTPGWSDAWITCPVRSRAEVEHAAWLFRLAHDRIRGTSDAELARRIGDGGGFAGA